MTLVVAIVIALWSASGGMAALITGIHVAHEHDEPKSFVAKRGKALGLTVGAIVFLGIVIFLIAALPPLMSDAGLGRPAGSAFEHPALADPRRGDDRRDRAALPVLDRRSSPRAWLGFVTAGAVVATIGWLIVSALFAVYTANFSSYSEDVRLAGLDRRAAALALAELAARADRRRVRRREHDLTALDGGLRCRSPRAEQLPRAGNALEIVRAERLERDRLTRDRGDDR